MPNFFDIILKVLSAILGMKSWEMGGKSEYMNLQLELTLNDSKNSSGCNICYYFAVEVETSAAKNCPSLRYWIHSGDGIRKGVWKNFGNLVTGVGKSRGSTSSFIFRSWQRKLRLI